MSFEHLATATQRQLIREGTNWGDTWTGRLGTTASTPIVRDSLAGFYCGVGQAPFGTRKLVDFEDATNEVLSLLVRQCADATIVSPDGEVAPDSLLYSVLDEFYRWSESSDDVVQDFGRRCVHAWNSLFALSNPGYELGLPTLPIAPPGGERGRPVPRGTGPSDATYDELIAELNSMVGLEDVKRQIMTEVSTQRANAERKRRGLPTVKPNLHMVFSGNPGTGKTTVARIVSEIYHRAGILSRGHVVEVGPGDMMGRFQGENTQRTQEIIESAIGGVLLVDEAYTLAGSPDRGPIEFQQQVIDTIVKGMEDYRGDLVVIFTGYSAPMERFIGTNAGLESRVGEWVDFPDYSPEELMSVFALLLDKYQMTIEEAGSDDLASELRAMKRNDRFGNARLIRNIFEDLVGVLNRRLGERDLTEVPTEELNGITREDVAQVREEILSGSANTKRTGQFGFLIV